MDFRLDQSLVALGIDTVVVGIARNVDPQAVLPPSFLEKKKAVEQWAREQGAARLELHTWDFNQGAIALYRAMGMTPQRYVFEKKL